MALDPDVSALVASLVQMSALLRKYDSGWTEELDRCRQAIENSDFYGVTRFRRLYGGMGSLNDVVLYRADEPVSASAADNKRFDTLRALAFDQAMRLAHDQVQEMAPPNIDG